MDFTATQEEIVAYIEKFSAETVHTLYGEDVRNVEVKAGCDFEEVMNTLRQVYGEVLAEEVYDSNIRIRPVNGHCYTDHYLQPVDYDEKEGYTYNLPKEEKQKQALYKEACLLVLRNTLFHCHSYDINISGFVAKRRDNDPRFDGDAMFCANITCNEGAYSAEAKIYFWEPEKGSYTEDYIFNIPPVKLTKFLRKVGFGEKFVTAFANKMPNKPKKYSLYLTDKYIPECYRLLSDHQNLTSCMSKRSDCYELPSDEHPTQAYNESEVLLLLIKDESLDGTDFPFVARSIVRRDNGRYIRLYGECVASSTFKHKLEVGDLEDLKINRIESDHGGYLLPYLDSCTDGCSVSDCGNFWVIDGGDHVCNYETGRSDSDDMCYCYCCDSSRYGYSMVDTAEDGDVCQSCIEEYYIEVAGEGYYRMDELNYSNYHGGYLLPRDSFYSELAEDYLLDKEDETEIAIELGIIKEEEEEESTEEVA